MIFANLARHRSKTMSPYYPHHGFMFWFFLLSLFCFFFLIVLFWFVFFFSNEFWTKKKCRKRGKADSCEFILHTLQTFMYIFLEIFYSFLRDHSGRNDNRCLKKRQEKARRGKERQGRERQGNKREERQSEAV